MSSFAIFSAAQGAQVKETQTLTHPYLLVNAFYSKNENELVLRVTEVKRKVKKAEEFSENPLFRVVTVKRDNSVIEERKFDFIRINEKVFDCPPDDVTTCKNTQVNAGSVWIYMKNHPDTFAVKIFKGETMVIEKKVKP